MANYMADRIIKGVYTYEYVVAKRPDLQEDIDIYLRAHGREDLIPHKAVTLPEL